MPSVKTSLHKARETALALVSLTAVAVAANLALSIGSAGAKNCPLSELGSIDFEIVNNQVLLPVTIDGHSAKMMLDTGDIATVLRGGDAQQFGLKVENLPAGSDVNFGPAKITQFAHVASLEVGAVHFGKSELLLIPPMRGGRPPWVGILGMNAFSKVDFELDFTQHKLKLYSQDHCPGAVVYWADQYSSAPLIRGPLGNYYFPIELEGKKIEAAISTAVGGNWLTTEVTRSLYGFDEKSPDIETRSNGVGGSVSQYRAMTLTGTGFQVKNAQIGLVTSKRPNCSLGHGGPGSAAMYTGCMGGEAPLKLGLDVAQHLHLYFATKEKVLYFTDAAASK
jgi:gag-polyprotein putative aspartyl protease